MRGPLLLLAAWTLCACDHRSAALAPDASPAPVSVAPPAPVASTVLDAAPIDSSWSADAAPYDLPTDLATRTATARGFFPASTYPAYATRLEASVYFLISPQAPATLSAGVDHLRRALRFYYDGHSTPGDASSPPPFARHADHAVSVYLFATRHEFVEFSRRAFEVDVDHPVLYGYYRPSERVIVLSGQEGWGTLNHEMIHPILDSDAPKLPRWMNEGLASLFEQPAPDADGVTMHGRSNERYRVLQRALAADAGAGTVPSLAALFAMSDHEFVGGSPLTAEGKPDRAAKDAAEHLHYGMARSFCQWLDSKHHKLWAFYHAWRDGFATDRTGEKAFAATMSGPPAALDGDWAAWVSAQRW
jgi:hypothetical protein